MTKKRTSTEDKKRPSSANKRKKKRKNNDDTFEVMATRSSLKKKKTDTVPVEKVRKKKKASSTSSSTKILSREQKAKLKKKLLHKEKHINSDLKELGTDLVSLPSAHDLVSLDNTHPSEKEFLTAFHNMFDDLLVMIDIAKARYVETEQSREIYALNVLYSQLRETISDMRGIQDMSQVSNALVVNVIDPTTQSIAQILIDMYFQVSTLIRSSVPPDKQEETLSSLKMVTATHAKRVEDQFAVAKDKIYTQMTSPS